MKIRIQTVKESHIYFTLVSKTTGCQNVLTLKRNNTYNYKITFWTDRYYEGGHENITGVRFSKNQKTKNRKTLDLNKIYLDMCSIYNRLMEENYITKVHQYKNELYG